MRLKAFAVEPGQIWQDEDGYLWKILHVEFPWVYARHSNSKRGSTQIRAEWFLEPGWRMTTPSRGSQR